MLRQPARSEYVPLTSPAVEKVYTFIGISHLRICYTLYNNPGNRNPSESSRRHQKNAQVKLAYLDHFLFDGHKVLPSSEP